MSLIDELVSRHAAPHVLDLKVRDVPMRLRTNVESVRDAMAKVYGRHAAPPGTEPRYTFWAIDGAFERPVDGFQDYVLPGGKAKERFKDEDGIRLVVKRKTGLWTIFDDARYVVIGPVDETENQLNNIINAVYMKDMDERGYLICQTAGLELGGAFVVVAGRSGAGKTTTMLKLMAAGASFVSNDRLLVKPSPSGIEMWGIPKWPRVNAGTMMGDDRLREILPAAARERYERMSYDELFALEEKYDLDVAEVYGADRVKDGGVFRRIYYLMWSRDGEGFAIDRVDTGDPAIWPELGPNLYRDAGVFDRRNLASRWRPEVEQRYRHDLRDAVLYAVRGRVDFPRIGGEILSHLGRDG